MPPVSRKPSSSKSSAPLAGGKGEGKVFLGIDPGGSGGIAALYPDGRLETHSLEKNTLGQTWRWLRHFGVPAVRPMSYTPTAAAVIEEIQPRPTSFFNGRVKEWQSSILRSTCLIYGSYQQLLGLLTAAGIPYYTAVPQRWMNDMELPKKNKGAEAERAWKNVLKHCAQEMFPEHKMTLGNCDAVLLARYAKLRWTGV